jgi:arsenate reductase
MKVTIYHNPGCGTSRNVLALIRAAGIEPEIVHYLDEPLSRDELKALFAATGAPVRTLLRRRGTPYDELGLDDPALTDAVVRHPILMNRPIVATGLGTALCRPSETVAKLLPQPPVPQAPVPQAPVPQVPVKEDGK